MRAATIAVISALATIGIVACAGDGGAATDPVEVEAPADTVDAGPAVGETIPANFAARDASGEERTLGTLAGDNGVVLVFNRSADWCSYCQSQMVSLNGIRGDLEERGYTLATISYDAPDVLADFSRRENIAYTMLSDQGSAMIDAFELRDPQYAEGSFAYGVPRPAIFVIGRDGRVRARMVESDYRIRPENADILTAIDRL
ncbi:MAG: peroxiredoxin family protein [Sphingomonadaceae bacterium]|nr:peroxiredoxin family protein [Sphingomonadaceae bacterium]